MKLAPYTRAGIPEYWLANATAEIVTVYRQPAGETYGEERVVGIAGTLRLLAFPDLAIRLADLFAWIATRR